MKKLLLLSALSISCITYTQNLDYNNSYESINICTAIQGNNFASERAADSALDDILNLIGASKRFVLQECSNINNAVALTMNGVRYIMYDPEFMVSLSYGDEWSNKFILAHEVGHHINGHTVDVLAANSTNRVSLSTSRIQELEADEFAGFVLGRLGASLSEALSGVQSLSDKDYSYSTHPRRSKRIAAIKKGFEESGGYVDSSNLSISKGKTVDSKYSNSRYAGVEYLVLNNYYQNAVYEGYVSVKSNDPFGYGTLYFDSGSKYEGEFSGGNYNGYGTLTLSNGKIKEGFWVNDNLVSGQIIYVDGRKNIGSFKDGDQLHGIGSLVFKNGDKLEGNFLDGKIIDCIYSSSKFKETIRTGFLDNSLGNTRSEFGGYTVFTDVWGNTYKGKFTNGWVIGDYITKSVKSKRKKMRKNGLDTFIPPLILNNLNINFPKWNGNAGYLRYEYDGVDKIEYLEKTYPDGRVFKGYFKDGFWNPIRAGYGEMTIPDNFNWPDGVSPKFDKFIGIYWDDKPNGYALCYYKGKIVQKGIYKNGEFVKSEDFDLKLMQKTLKKFY
jgi:hypothetical protein